MTPGEARQRFATARVAYLASVRPTGAPHLVPVTFAVDDDRIYTAVDAKPKRTRRLTRLHNIGHDPRVCVLADQWDEDWSRLWWVRADGIARVVPADARGITLLQARYRQYQAEAPPGPVIVVDVDRWTGWAAVSRE